MEQENGIDMEWVRVDALGQCLFYPTSARPKKELYQEIYDLLQPYGLFIHTENVKPATGIETLIKSGATLKSHN